MLDQISCLHKLQLQAGRLRYNIFTISGSFSLFTASSYMDVIPAKAGIQAMWAGYVAL